MHEWKAYLFCNHFSQKQLFALKCSAKMDILQAQCKLARYLNLMHFTTTSDIQLYFTLQRSHCRYEQQRKKIAHSKTQHAGTSSMSMFLSSLTRHVLRRIILTSLVGQDQRPARRLNEMPITCPSLSLLEYECSLSQGSGSYQVNILNIEIPNLILNGVFFKFFFQ